MNSADKIYLDIPYNSCRITGAVCERGDCRTCTIPIILKDRAEEILRYS